MEKNGAESKKTCLLLAVLGLSAALVCMGWCWFSYDRGRMEVSQAIEKAVSGSEAEQAMAHIGAVSAGITWGLVLTGAFLLFGAAMLSVGLLRLPREERPGELPWSAVAVSLLLISGFGLGLMALADYLRFDHYLHVLWFLT